MGAESGYEPRSVIYKVEVFLKIYREFYFLKNGGCPTILTIMNKNNNKKNEYMTYSFDSGLWLLCNYVDYNLCVIMSKQSHYGLCIFISGLTTSLEKY